MTKVSSPSTLSLADQVRSIALEGLKFTSCPYDRARFEKLLEASSAVFADTVKLDVGTLIEQFRRELGSVTPKVGADAAVFNDKGQLLVLERADKTGWCLPCGWVDVGESPASGAVRETFEETGLRVEALGYISISTIGPGKTQNLQHAVCTLIATKLLSDPAEVKIDHENTGFRWIDEGTELPLWHGGHHEQVARAFRYRNNPGMPLLPVE